MRILFLEQYNELGGAQQTLLDTVDAAKHAGWDPQVLVPGHGPLVEALRSRNVPVGEIPCGPYRSGSKSVLDCVRFATDFRRQVRLIREAVTGANIDLIYVNGPRLLPAAAMAAKKQTPVVFHVHNHSRGAALDLTRWILRSNDAAVVGCSKSVLEPLRRPTGAQRRQVIPNGVRDAGYRERRFDFRDRLRIGTIGRIAPEKGQMEFVQAAALIKNDFPQAHFVIYGAPMFDSGRDYFEAVRRRAQDLPVEFAGWRPDVSAVLNELDLLAVPSLEEGMGRVVLEAFSAGVPVLAFPTGGIPEAVVDGFTGFLTRGRSGASLAESMRNVLATDSDVLVQIARNARQAWARSYSLKIYQERITKLLATLVSKGRVIEMPLQPQ